MKPRRGFGKRGTPHLYNNETLPAYGFIQKQKTRQSSYHTKQWRDFFSI
jgi:hypothetical protein